MASPLIEVGFIQTTVDKAKPVTATQYKASVQGIVVREEGDLRA